MMGVLDDQVRLHFSHRLKDRLQRVAGQSNLGGHIDAFSCPSQSSRRRDFCKRATPPALTTGLNQCGCGSLNTLINTS